MCVCGRGTEEGEQSCETYPSHATSPQLRGASGWLRGPWWLGPEAPGLRVGGGVSGSLPQGKPGWSPLSRGPWGVRAPGSRGGRAPTAAPSPRSRLLCVAVKRLSINPVWTVERERKGCLLSG